MGRGTKFNARQEEAMGMEWMGLKRWRFYLKCSSCSQEMTFLTDPENDHYVTEHGCTRNLEPWRVKQEADKLLDAKQKQIESDSMRALEEKSSIIKNQLDLMETISDLQDINKRNAVLNTDKVIESLQRSKATKRSILDEQDDAAEIEQFRARKKRKINETESANDIDVERKKMKFDFKPIVKPQSESTAKSLSDPMSKTESKSKDKKKKKKKSKKRTKTIQLWCDVKCSLNLLQCTNGVHVLYSMSSSDI